MQVIKASHCDMIHRTTTYALCTGYNAINVTTIEL